MSGEERKAWAFGLSGQLATWANLTAVALVMWMFYQGQQNFYVQVRDDRELFKSALREMRSDSERQWEATRGNQRAIEILTNDIRLIVKSRFDWWPFGDIRSDSSPAPEAKPSRLPNPQENRP